MRAWEFEARLGADANLKVPEDLAAEIPKEEPVRVIVLISDSGEDGAWRQSTGDQFLRGYSEGDSIYDAI